MFWGGSVALWRIDSGRAGCGAVAPLRRARVATAATEADAATVSQRVNVTAATPRHMNRFAPPRRLIPVHLVDIDRTDRLLGARQARSVRIMAIGNPVRTRALTTAQADILRGWTDAIERWPVGSHVWGQYAEQIEDRVAVCRTENVSACHPGVAALVEGTLRAVATDTLGDPATPFKDKI